MAENPSTPPAGGAAIGEVIGATTGALILTAALLYIGWAHRTGRIDWLRRAADRMGEVAGAPSWAVLPGNIASISLLVAVFGMYWDISLHIGEGRDPGPLANPAHYFILAGLFGIFAAGFLAIVLPDGKPSRSAIRITGDWYAPVGGIVLFACGAFALLGFPLDDMWHRLFGQDVTLWGPTHLMLIGGAGLSLLGMATLMVEGGRDTEKADDGSRAARIMALIYKTRFAGVAGGLLVGLSTFQAEFDFGVPQFRFLFEPVMLAFAAAGALVAARIYAGRGAALVAWLYYIVIRGALALIVGPILGEPTPHFPLYLGEAVLVEAIALAIAPRTRPLLFGAVSGISIATVGFAAEYGWSHVFMPISWPETLISESIVVVPIVGIAAGIIGGFIGACLAAPRARSAVRTPGLALPGLAVVAIAVVIGYGLQTNHQEGVTGSVTLDEVNSGPERTVNATVRFDPASAPDGADWVRGIAWQGGGLVEAAMEEVQPGVWRTTEPLPVYGDWKALIRLHEGSSILGLPVYLPEDPAIPAEGIAAAPSFDRTFVPEKQILQREAKTDVASALPPIAYAVVGLIFVGLISLLGWAMARVARGGPPEEGSGAETAPRRTAVPTPAKGPA